ncbi:MAG: hypothetical protein ACLRQF_11980 [Thomasclavelia ramosa]
MEKKIFCKSGGCSAKLGAGVLDHVLAKLPRKEDKNLLVGYDTKDDASVYKLCDDLAIVTTLDFFQRWLKILIYLDKLPRQMR